MKYFIVADIHGCFDELMEALNNSGFDEENPNHTLVSLGDAMDRGTKPLEVIEYLMGIKRKILIRGNHEDLMEQLLKFRRPLYGYDEANGTFQSICKLTGWKGDEPWDEDFCYNHWQEACLEARKTCVLRYINTCIPYYELKDFILVHGWMPMNENGEVFLSKDPNDWESARWTDGYKQTYFKRFYKKTIICGHVATWFWNHNFKGEDTYDIYETKDVIALDGKVYKTQKLNCYIIEE